MQAATLALLLGATLLGIGLACSDDDLTFEEYYGDFQAIEDAMRGNLGELFIGFNPATADAESRAAFADVMHNSLDDFEDLRPGPEFRESHNAFVRTSREQADAIAADNADRRTKRFLPRLSPCARSGRWPNKKG